MEGVLDLGAGGVSASVRDPGQAVTTLTRERDVTVGLTIELGAEADEVLEHRRPTDDDLSDDGGFAELAPQAQGVCDVILEGVLGREDRRDAALGIAGVAFTGFALRQQSYRVPSLSRFESGDTTSSPTTHHDQVEGV